MDGGHLTLTSPQEISSWNSNFHPPHLLHIVDNASTESLVPKDGACVSNTTIQLDTQQGRGGKGKTFEVASQQVNLEETTACREMR